ncbi:MAG: dTDP-4-dehydrorhamnose reductase [Alphaproteobacteria bacterium]|nr:dTDP-4-dehydrorhamnose reductase [Alphaproteobacteria bacterium]
MILVLGKNGQVGGALAKLLGSGEVAFDSQEINLTQPDFTDRLTVLFQQHDFSTIINAAAYTQVDKAESEPELAMRINGNAVGELAGWCKTHDVTLVHYSTDYVFDGSGTKPHTEEEATAPLSVYGESKLRGERLITESGAEHLIVRTSWVYDASGKNFFTTMRRLFMEREELKIVADQAGAPTYAPHLARATLAALEAAKKTEHFPSGIYHLCGGSETSWYGFARAILGLASGHESGIKCRQLQPIPTCEYPTEALRPLNSRLDCTKAETTFGVRLPHWEDALKECYESIRLRH